MKDKKYKLTQEDVGRERLLVNQETDEDVVLNMSLRPTKLAEFVGQAELIENLKI